LCREDEGGGSGKGPASSKIAEGTGKLHKKKRKTGNGRHKYETIQSNETAWVHTLRRYRNTSTEKRTASNGGNIKGKTGESKDIPATQGKKKGAKRTHILKKKTRICFLQGREGQLPEGPPPMGYRSLYWRAAEKGGGREYSLRSETQASDERKNTREGGLRGGTMPRDES